MVKFRSLKPDQWRELRRIRLRALRDSPDTFLATYDKERKYTKARWIAEFDRGSWIVGERHHRRVFMVSWPGRTKVSLVGITHDAVDDLVTERTERHFVEFMWVHRKRRKSGIARHMLNYAIDSHFLANSSPDDEDVPSTEKLYLWVLNGNFPAFSLYKRMGFVEEGISNQLAEQKPGRWEDQMSLNLKEHFAAIRHQRPCWRQ